MGNSLGMFAGRDALAGYAKEDQQTYNQTFMPELMHLREIGLGMGEGNVYDAAKRGVEGAGRTFDSTMGSYARDRERAGMRVDAATGASQNRRLSLSRIISQVDAGNRASRGAKDAQRAAQDFGMQTYGDSVVGANQTLASIANSEADRDAQYRKAKADDKAGDLAAIGQIASMAAMAFMI